MNMLVQPAPLPEEMDRGYLGRIMRINGYRSPKDMVEAMAGHFGKEGKTRREVTTHELLSRMAGMTTEHFAQRHTTMPLRRGLPPIFQRLCMALLSAQVCYTSVAPCESIRRPSSARNV